MMNMMSSESTGRLEHWIRTLREDLYTPVLPLDWEVCHPDHELDVDDLDGQTFRPAPAGYTWGASWQYAWFRTSFTVPEDLAGAFLVMDLQPGWEATVFVNGEAYGTWRADWIKYPHHYMVDNYLTEHAKAGDMYTICMEVYAGHYYEGMDMPAAATGPLLPGLYRNQRTEGCRVTLGRGTIGIWDETAYQLFMDVEVLYSLYKTLDQTTLRASKIADTLEDFTMAVDFEQPKEGRDEDYARAREILKPALQAENGSTAPVFAGIGNAHLDLAWLWTMDETRRKTARTFAAQLRLLEKYPEYLFLASMPAEYELCKTYYPRLFDRIRREVKAGRWIAEGAMWVEPDTNMIGGEALIRQILYGKKYYKEVFGIDSVMLWLPDTFGYTAALPQILKKTGVKYLVTQKIFWSYNEGEPFPYHYFSWKGMDGSEVEAFLPTRYEYYPSPEEMKNVWKNRTQKRHLDEFLMPFGYGDGGGGPTRDHIEMIRRQKNLEGDLKMRIESPIDFFERMDLQGGPVNTYDGELYFTAHRGTYTGQANIKKLNRRTEILLRELEYYNVLASLQTGMSGVEPAKDGLEALWKELLTHQFHDILPGSSIGKVYQQAEERLKKLDTEIEEETRTILDSLTKPGRCCKESLSSGPAFTFWNSLSHRVTRLVTVPESTAKALSAIESSGRVPVLVPEDASGTPGSAGGSARTQGAADRDYWEFPVYKEPDGSWTALVSAEGLSAVTLIAAPVSGSPAASGQAPTLSPASATKPVSCACSIPDGGAVLENSRLRVAFNGKGEITSYITKKNETEFAGGTMNHFRLFREVPRKFDAWDLDSNYVKQEVPTLENAKLEIIKAGGSSAVLRLSGKISFSTLEQTISLDANSEVVVFDTTIDWKETHRILKVEAQTNLLTETGLNEIQFGYVERPACRSRVYDQERFEVCNHRYSALCESGRGFAVLNDCKYGISMNDGAMGLSLLTASTCPDVHADRHVHHIRYGYTAYNGSFLKSKVPMYGMELNEVPRITPAAASVPSCLLDIGSDNIFLESVKLAEDGSGDIIFRLYEGMKTLTVCEFHAGFPFSRVRECDMLENVTGDVACEGNTFRLKFGAFEIKTIRLTR